MQHLLSRLLLCLLAFSQVSACAAPASTTHYREMIVVQQQIWLLTENGHIVVYDVGGKQQPLPGIEKVKAEHLIVDGNTVAAQIGSTIQRWNKSISSWEPVGKLTRNVFGLVATSQHQFFAITDMGVLDVATGYSKLPTASPNSQLRQLTSLGRPATFFMDSRDNLWIGFGYGEWGGNIFVYSTQRHKFLDLSFNKFSIELSPIKSFFQLKDGVGVSSGLQHFMTSGTIAEFTNFSARTLYDTRTERDSARNQKATMVDQPYIGPAVYDAVANCIFFYSHLGVYAGIYGSDLTKLTSWHKVFTPQLHWSNGQPDAVGSPMNVLNMLSLGDGKLVLLTQKDGVGIWDGKTFNLLP
jgi:hypothetical protein